MYLRATSQFRLEAPLSFFLSGAVRYQCPKFRRNGSPKRQRCSALVSFSSTCSIVGKPRHMAAANCASRGGSGRAVVATKRAGPLVNLGLYCRLPAGSHQHGCLDPHRNKSKWAIMEPSALAHASSTALAHIGHHQGFQARLHCGNFLTLACASFVSHAYI